MAVRIPVNGKDMKAERKHLTQNQKHDYLKRLILCLMILLCAVLQNTPHCFPTIAGCHAWLLLPLCVCISMFEKELSGVFYCIFAGALWDAVSAALDGMNAIYFFLASTAVILLMTYLMRNNLVTALLLSLGVVLLYTLLHWLIFVVFRGVSGAGYQLVRFYLPSALYTYAFTPLFYIIVRSFLKRLRAKYPKNSIAHRP